jgi:hypothetical protein
MSNKIAQKNQVLILHTTSSLQSTSTNISLRDKVFHNYSYFLQESIKLSSPSTEAELLRVVQLDSMPGYKYPNIESGAAPIGSAAAHPIEIKF